MVKKQKKHKRCEECGFWYKAENVKGGICSKCNKAFLGAVTKEAGEEVFKFWDEAPGAAVASPDPVSPDYMQAVQETAEWASTEAAKKAKPGWAKVAKAFAEKVKAQQASDSDPLLTAAETLLVPGGVFPLIEALAGAYEPEVPAAKPKPSAYHCKTCGKALTWAEIKVSQILCAGCMPLMQHEPALPTVIVAGLAPSAEVPPLLQKSAYAKEKLAWVKELAGLVEKKGSADGESEVSSQETLVAKSISAPLKGHQELGEPVIEFTISQSTDPMGKDPPLMEVPFEKVTPEEVHKYLPATSTTKPYPAPPPLEKPTPPPGWKPFPKMKMPKAVGQKGVAFKKLAALAAQEKALEKDTILAYHESLPQKAKGMTVLAAAFAHSKTLETLCFRTELEITQSKHTCWMGMSEVFLRPAPSVPQHGFIDSRPCKGTLVHERKKEAKALLREVLERDPGGALLVCRYYESRRNAIVTPVGITFGEGHDGATAGKNTWSVPLVAGPMPITKMERAVAGIPEDAMPFVEVVFPYYTDLYHPDGIAVDSQEYAFPIVVQLRAGPAVESEVDFVPGLTTVTEVYEVDPATESLDGWPAKVKGFAAEKYGLVVYHPGGSLLSHFGANAALAGVAYVTSHKPVVGEKLDPGKKPKGFVSQTAFLAGFVRGLGEVMDSTQARSDAVAFVLVVGHSVLRMQEGKFGYYLGVACAFMCRLGMAASIGERRHSKKAKHEGKSRDALFKEVLSKGESVQKYVEFRRRLVEAHGAFKNEHWPGGYGGKAWAACALATIGLDAAVMEVAQKEEGVGMEGLVEVGMALHNAINQAHNNGWWLNKFAYHHMCDEAAVGRLSVVVQALRWFDVIGEVHDEDLIVPSARIEALLEGQVLVVQGPIRAVAIREAQMRLDWNDNPLCVHVQYRVQGTKGMEYSRQDVMITSDQRATLHLHCAGMVKGQSWGSKTMEYYPLEVYPGSNVVGVTLVGSVFFPVTALKGG